MFEEGLLGISKWKLAPEAAVLALLLQRLLQFQWSVALLWL